MIQFNLDPADSNAATPPLSVSVIGIGGSGTNVIDKIALEGMSGADLVSLNCDVRALNTSMAGTKDRSLFVASPRRKAFHHLCASDCLFLPKAFA